MTIQERVFLNELQELCTKHKVRMWFEDGNLYFVDNDRITKRAIDILVTEDLLDE